MQIKKELMLIYPNGLKKQTSSFLFFKIIQKLSLDQN